MKVALFLTIIFLNKNLYAQSGTGLNPNSPSTMSQESYPNSGPTENRRDVMGKELNSQTNDSASPQNSAKQEKQKQEKEPFWTGP